MKLGTLVEHGGRRGVVVSDIASCCSPDETPVVFDGETAFLGVPTNELRDLGPENPLADFEKCGGGKGAACCIFLTVGGQGFNCERHSELRNTLLFKTGMTAQRHPKKLYPGCQDLKDGLPDNPEPIIPRRFPQIGDKVEFRSDRQTEKGPSAGAVIEADRQSGLVRIRHSDHPGELFDWAKVKIEKFLEGPNGQPLWVLE